LRASSGASRCLYGDWFSILTVALARNASIFDGHWRILLFIELDLSYNRLANLPEERWDVLASMKVLNVSFNSINMVPADLPYLYRIEIFNAASNDLTSLPSDIVKMTGLKNIDVSDNLMSECVHIEQNTE
jgi:hypothetical protein